MKQCLQYSYEKCFSPRILFLPKSSIKCGSRINIFRIPGFQKKKNQSYVPFVRKLLVDLLWQIAGINNERDSNRIQKIVEEPRIAMQTAQIAKGGYELFKRESIQKRGLSRILDFFPSIFKKEKKREREKSNSI